MPVTSPNANNSVSYKQLSFYLNQIFEQLSNSVADLKNGDMVILGENCKQGEALGIGSDGKYYRALITSADKLPCICFASIAGLTNTQIPICTIGIISLPDTTLTAQTELFLIDGSPNIGTDIDDDSTKITQSLGEAINEHSFRAQIGIPIYNI
jgi:hypothetical protein